MVSEIPKVTPKNVLCEIATTHSTLATHILITADKQR